MPGFLKWSGTKLSDSHYNGVVTEESLRAPWKELQSYSEEKFLERVQTALRSSFLSIQVCFEGKHFLKGRCIVKLPCSSLPGSGTPAPDLVFTSFLKTAFGLNEP